MNALPMALAAVLVAATGASAHETHDGRPETFAAGVPGKPAKAARAIEFACLIPGHYVAGMHSSIVVGEVRGAR